MPAQGEPSRPAEPPAEPAVRYIGGLPPPPAPVGEPKTHGFLLFAFTAAITVAAVASRMMPFMVAAGVLNFAATPFYMRRFWERNIREESRARARPGEGAALRELRGPDLGNPDMSQPARTVAQRRPRGANQHGSNHLGGPAPQLRGPIPSSRSAGVQRHL